MTRVAVVTDSTAYLPQPLVERYGIGVVPMTVVVSGKATDELAVTAQQLSSSLSSWDIVTTAGPNPARFLAVYRELAAAGATHIVSVHLSALMSGTYAVARVAAETAPVPVTVIDSRTVGMALGYSVLAAARKAHTGGSVAEVADRAHRTAQSSAQFFYVDTMEHLRRGGRISAGQALLGQALSVKPLLRVHDGKVDACERVRTSSRALSRLEDLIVESADRMSGSLDIAVHHLDAQQRAESLRDRLVSRLGPRLADAPVVTEVGAAVGAHVGPGMVAAVVSPHLM